jgi:hypothetical protein
LDLSFVHLACKSRWWVWSWIVAVLDLAVVLHPAVVVKFAPPASVRISVLAPVRSLGILLSLPKTVGPLALINYICSYSLQIYVFIYFWKLYTCNTWKQFIFSISTQKRFLYCQKMAAISRFYRCDTKKESHIEKNPKKSFNIFF